MNWARRTLLKRWADRGVSWRSTGIYGLDRHYGCRPVTAFGHIVWQDTLAAVRWMVIR